MITQWSRVSITGLCITICCSFFWIGGCALPDQRKTVEGWYEQYRYFRQMDGRRFSSSHLVSKIGKPDYVARGVDLNEVIPDAECREIILNSAGASFERAHGQDERDFLPGWGAGVVAQYSFWFYDEAARYLFPSQRASVFGMGTGYQVVCFVVNDSNDIVAVGAGGFPDKLLPSYSNLKGAP
jgi:hypothetical protein